MGNGPLSIGKNVMMGPEVMIITREHKTDISEVPMIQQGYEAPKPTTIGDDVFIGARVVITCGVFLGAHSVVGAGTVVTKDIPEYSFVAGSPFRIIRSRST